jgi:hypothetical protein
MYEHVFRYCERGQDPSFWAEPLNAISNVAFLIAAAAAYVRWRDRPPYERSRFTLFLIALVFVIGIGSFLFHTFANGWSGAADVIPIGAFMLSYLGFALIKLAGFGWRETAFGMGAFILACAGAGQIGRHDGHIGFLTSVPGGADSLFMNGSAGYLPALAALFLLGLRLFRDRRPSGAPMLAASGVFLVSVALRSLDFTLCDAVAIGGRRVGTHFLWHLLNAATLYLLLLAALRDKPAWRRQTALASSFGGAGSSRPGSRSHKITPFAAASRRKAKPKPEIIPPRPGVPSRRPR